MNTYLLGELPKALLEDVSRDLRSYSLGFRIHGEYGDPDEPKLLGSGTLIRVDNIFAILTADHVLDHLRGMDRLGLLLESNSQPASIKGANLIFLTIGRGSSEADGPDLGAVILDPTSADSLAAKKSFFNVSAAQYSNSDLQENYDDLWMISGFIDELSEIFQMGAGRKRKLFKNETLFGGLEDGVGSGDFDYFEFSSSEEGQEQAPWEFGGMSGGGLWMTQVSQNSNNEFTFTSPVLRGVPFYQLPTQLSGVKCHGWSSIYRKAAGEIRRPSNL